MAWLLLPLVGISRQWTQSGGVHEQMLKQDAGAAKGGVTTEPFMHSW